MVRGGLVEDESDERRQAPPGDAALRAEIHAWWDRRPTLHVRVIGPTDLLDPVVKLGFGKQLVQFSVRRMRRQSGQGSAHHPQCLLLSFACVQGHHDTCFVHGGTSNPSCRYYHSWSRGLFQQAAARMGIGRNHANQTKAETCNTSALLYDGFVTL
jgi:hypothetical protein